MKPPVLASLAVLALAMRCPAAAADEDYVAAHFAQADASVRLASETLDAIAARLDRAANDSPEAERARESAIRNIASWRDVVADDAARVTFARNGLADGSTAPGNAVGACHAEATDALVHAFDACIQAASTEVTLLERIDRSRSTTRRSALRDAEDELAHARPDDVPALTAAVAALRSEIAEAEATGSTDLQVAHLDVTAWLLGQRRLLCAAMWSLADFESKVGHDRNVKDLERELYTTFDVGLPSRGEAFLRTRLGVIATTRSRLDRELERSGGSDLQLELESVLPDAPPRVFTMTAAFQAEPVESLRPVKQ